MEFSQLMFFTVSLSVVVLVYLTTADCNSSETTKSHNLTIGCRNQNDKLLFNETISEEKSGAISKDIRFPEESIKEGYFITYVEVEDKCQGGFVNITSGGPGYPFVSLHLALKEGKRFEFRISIYGHKL